MLAEDWNPSYGSNRPFYSWHGGKRKRIDGDFGEDMIGSGEGGKSHGWGFYLSDARWVAEIYSYIANVLDPGDPGRHELAA